MFTLSRFLGLFPLLPAIIAAIRLPAMSSEFDAFVIAIWLKAFNSVFGLIITHFGFYNIVHYNIWYLADAFILLWAFKTWYVFKSNKIFYSIAVFFGIVYLVETISFSKLSEDYNSYFRIISNFIIALMSISMINILLLKATISPLKNSIFLICCTFVLLNTIAVIGEAFFAYNLIMGNEFRIFMDRLINFIDALCSLVFALIILWIPKKQAFTLQY